MQFNVAFFLLVSLNTAFVHAGVGDCTVEVNCCVNNWDACMNQEDNEDICSRIDRGGINPNYCALHLVTEGPDAGKKIPNCEGDDCCNMSDGAGRKCGP